MTIKKVGNLTSLEKQLLKALKAAREHLEYCNYGVEFERERAKHRGLDEQISKAIAFAEKKQKE